MNEKFDLEFCYKGDRKYVHGTDIFTKLLERYENTQKIDISFHGISINNLTFFTQKPENKEITVSFRCLNDTNKIKIFGVQNKSSIKCKYEYLEKNIIDNSQVNLNENSIELKTKTKYSFIEHMVAMNKALVENLYTDINGKWYFTRLQLKENIDIADIKSIKLNLLSNFQFKLTKSSIIVNNKEIGFIYFSLILKES